MLSACLNPNSECLESFPVVKKKKNFWMFPPLLAVCKPSFLRNQIVVLELIVAFNRVFVPVQTFPSLQSTLFFPPPPCCHIYFISLGCLMVGQFCLMGFKGVFATGQKKTIYFSPTAECKFTAFTEVRSRWLNTCLIRRWWFAAKINRNWILKGMLPAAPDLRMLNAI